MSKIVVGRDFLKFTCYIVLNFSDEEMEIIGKFRKKRNILTFIS